MRSQTTIEPALAEGTRISVSLDDLMEEPRNLPTVLNNDRLSGYYRAAVFFRSDGLSGQLGPRQRAAARQHPRALADIPQYLVRSLPALSCQRPVSARSPLSNHAADQGKAPSQDSTSAAETGVAL
jgi:hypothetical protein